MASGGIEAYRSLLFPFAEIVTPNLSEAAVLCDVETGDVTNIDDLVLMAKKILAMGPSYVLIKGGHFLGGDSNRTPDVLVGSRKSRRFPTRPRVATQNDHGTGCSLSSAIAAGLGLGRSLPDATRDAKSFVLAALEGAAEWKLGGGRGPIDHLGWNE